MDAQTVHYAKGPEAERRGQQELKSSVFSACQDMHSGAITDQRKGHFLIHIHHFLIHIKGHN